MSIIIKRDRFHRDIGYGTGRVLWLSDPSHIYDECELNGNTVLYFKVGISRFYDKEIQKAKYQVAICYVDKRSWIAKLIPRLNYYCTVQIQGIVEIYPELGEYTNTHGRKGQIRLEWLNWVNESDEYGVDVLKEQVHERKSRKDNGKNGEDFSTIETEEEYGF